MTSLVYSTGAQFCNAPRDAEQEQDVALMRKPVLHVIPSVSPARGGPSRMIQVMTEALAERGCRTHVATTNDDGPDCVVDIPVGKPINRNGVTYFYFRRSTRRYTVSLGLSNWLRRNVRAYTLVHIHSVFSFPSTAAMYWARKMHVPYIVRPLGGLTRWSVEHRRPLLKRVSLAAIERPALARAALLHFTSALEMQEGESCGVVGHGHIIPNGIPIQPCDESIAGAFRSSYGISPGATVVLFLSRLDAKKGLDLLIPAFAEARKTTGDLVLAIVGEGSPGLVERVRRLAEEECVQDFIVWTGFLEGAAKASAVTDSDIFILPSYSENFGVAVLEAMAAGRAVIVSDKVALASDIQRRGAGIVTRCSVSEVADAIVALAADAALRRELGERAINLAREMFSSHILAKNLIDAYRSIV